MRRYGWKRIAIVLLLSLLCAVPAVLLPLYAVFSGDRQLAGAAVDNVLLPLRRSVGAVFGQLPFSVMELGCTLLGLSALAFLVWSAVRIIRGPRRLRALLGRLGILGLTVLYAVTGCLWLWCLDYQAPSFSEREGFARSGVTREDLYETTEYFIRQALARAESVPRDENGRFAGDLELCFDRADQVYRELEREFPSLAGPTFRPKKMALYSKLMSATGFTGVYFCFTGESNINIDQPAAFIPSTIAHELAHQRGVASEQECNFLGIMAGAACGIPEYEYSCFLTGSVHLMNALLKSSPEQWRELQKEITGPMQTDLEENNEYWRTRKTKVTQVTKQAYDAYLKVNGQELGIESYGACVDLLVAYHIRSRG